VQAMVEFAEETGDEQLAEYGRQLEAEMKAAGGTVDPLDTSGEVTPEVIAGDGSAPKSDKNKKVPRTPLPRRRPLATYVCLTPCACDDALLFWGRIETDQTGREPPSPSHTRTRTRTRTRTTTTTPANCSIILASFRRRRRRKRRNAKMISADGENYRCR
jgi:hypothetical protein